ncbi:MAG: hypothetical protein K6F54_10895 [Lachnospiraceae bacterium]|nr:hypothetical protein [Lachnospiraceae bacterium]
MKIKCDYCDNTYEDTLPQCPYCEAPNPSHQQVHGQPKTIAELQKWYADRNLPPYEVTRFFIGEDHKGPRAFGIYQDPGNGQFIVYKNKDDGSRAVRYQGTDEEYAVNELYQKLKDEIVHQKARNTGHSSSQTSSNSQKTIGKVGIALLAGFLIGGFALSSLGHEHDGYYNYNGTTYYSYDNNWFYYNDDYDGWYQTDSYDPGVNAISESYDDYYVSEDWNSGIEASDWDNSEFYDDYHSSSDYDSDYDSDSDSDWDWDSGSDWDSGGTDWDSDW